MNEVMLACSKPVEIDQLKFPVYIQPKLDGVRCTLRNGECWSRTNRLIPNKDLQLLAAKQWAAVKAEWPDFSPEFDGELWHKDMTFNEIQSVVMSHNVHRGNVQFYCFDMITLNANFTDRHQLVRKFCNGTIPIVPTHYCITPYEVRHWRTVYKDFEGLVARKPTGFYKRGRTTMLEGTLLKIVDWLRDEATIIDLEERLLDQYPSGTLGALVVKHPEFGVFKIGTGYTEDERHNMWTRSLIGKQVTFKYKPAHIKTAPAPAVFVGLRTEGM